MKERKRRSRARLTPPAATIPSPPDTVVFLGQDGLYEKEPTEADLRMMDDGFSKEQKAEILATGGLGAIPAPAKPAVATPTSSGKPPAQCGVCGKGEAVGPLQIWRGMLKLLCEKCAAKI